MTYTDTDGHIKVIVSFRGKILPPDVALCRLYVAPHERHEMRILVGESNISPSSKGRRFEFVVNSGTWHFKYTTLDLVGNESELSEVATVTVQLKEGTRWP